MKKKIIVVFVLIIFFLFFPLSKNQAQIITPSPQLTIVTAPNNNEINILINLLKRMFETYNEDSHNNQRSPLNKKTPIKEKKSGKKKPSKTPTIPNGKNPSAFPDIKATPDVNGLVYYSQCQGPYDNYPLPQGGTVCQAGCGPTTVAMIVASYIDKSITPPKIVEEYKKSGYYLGPAGSYYSHAENVIKKHNLKTTYIFADNQAKTVDQVMNQFGGIIKNYQKSGWTFFALANFCDGGCGHFFWIIKIDEGLNIWAYDPAYDIKLPKPINHKKRYPFPKLRIIFGVKK